MPMPIHQLDEDRESDPLLLEEYEHFLSVRQKELLKSTYEPSVI